jgi:prepilin-type N-terminal cleavage/methylation domain-containing protein
MSRRHGFTLLEIMLVVMIGTLMMMIAVPSVGAFLREQTLKESFEAFDAFARKAQSRAMSEGGTFVMVWDKDGISLQALDPVAAEAEGGPERFDFAEGTTWTLQRPAALVKKPVWEWPFWRSGACEPVTISFEGPAGSWSAEYNGLTARGKIVDMDVK